jgi:NAD(P)H-dependent FMN reductase
MHTIRIVLGSTRPERVSPRIAEWFEVSLRRAAEQAGDVTVETTDLKELALPFFDEPSPPIFGTYTHAHTRAWAETVDATDGFVFIAPEYNHSYSAVLKNALDFLNREWHHKPVGFVSYGGHAGGTRATEHLRSIVGELRMYDIGEMVLVPHYWDYLTAEGAFAPPAEYAAAAEAMAGQLVYWTRVMRAAREGLHAR